MRAAAAAIVGYVVYFIWIAASFSLLWMATGASFAYEPGGTDVTPGWLLASTPLSFIGAILGGWTAWRVAGRNVAGAKVLAALVLILGLVVAVANLKKDRSVPAGKTPSSFSAMEAGEYSIQPTWFDFVVPLLGAVGVMVGGRRRVGKIEASRDSGLSNAAVDA